MMRVEQALAPVRRPARDGGDGAGGDDPAAGQGQGAGEGVEGGDDRRAVERCDDSIERRQRRLHPFGVVDNLGLMEAGHDGPAERQCLVRRDGSDRHGHVFRRYAAS